MNKHNRLLAVLNDVFGMESILKSEFRKVGQYLYDLAFSVLFGSEAALRIEFTNGKKRYEVTIDKDI